MLSVEEARAIMLAGVAPLASERVALDEACGRTLATDIIARGSQPPFNASAMDGWAVRRADTPGTLKIVGESAAGRGYGRPLKAGEAVRIFTGAPVPEGADAVVIQENARQEGGHVIAPAAGDSNVRPMGQDFAAGARLIERGARLDGVALALAAAAGDDPIAVVRAPRVLILATGDELIAPGAPLGGDQIFESVSFGLAALARQWGGAPRRLAAVGDTVEAIAGRVGAPARESDLVVTIGGASVGDYDLVKPAVRTLGAEIVVENVAIRPGKPTWFAHGAGGVFLGLPGNPASALVCAHLFLRPLLDALLGRAPSVAFVKAQLAAPLPANGPREHYIRARLTIDPEGRARVAPYEKQDSSLLSVFQSANALARLPARAPVAAAGALIDVLPLER